MYSIKLYRTYFPLRSFLPSVSFFLALAVSEGLGHLGSVDAVGLDGFLNPDRGSVHHAVGAGVSEATVCKHGTLDSLEGIGAVNTAARIIIKIHIHLLV